MTHSPSDVLRKLLIDLGVGADPPATPWPIYVGGEPPSPDNAVTIYDTAGADGGRAMFAGTLLGWVGVQVRVRSSDHPTGWTKADAIQTTLAESVYDERVTVGASTYLVHCLSKIGDVLAIGKESPTSKRSLFTFNALMSVKQL